MMEDITKLKVAELRAELSKRGLDSKGLKPVLVERLRMATEKEEKNEIAESDECEMEDETETIPKEEPMEIGQHQEEIKADLKENIQEAINTEDVKEASSQYDNSSAKVKDEAETSFEEPATAQEESLVSEEEPATTQEETVTSQVEPAITQEVMEVQSSDAAAEAPIEKSESSKGKRESFHEQDDTAHLQVESSEAPSETDNAANENGDVANEEKSAKRPREESPSADDVEKRRKLAEREYEKTKRLEEETERRMKIEEALLQENEPEFDKSFVALDWYNSDLSLMIEAKQRLEAEPMTKDGFAYVWHGVRASYGISKGKVFYEVAMLDNMDISHLEEAEPCPHALRVGWSIDMAGLTLGEDKFSYGYGSSAKSSTDLKFTDYGKTFGKGDIIGCFIDFDSEKVTMMFTVNGESQGVCYEIEKEELGENALFPHILTKNSKFSVNFGDSDAAFEPLDGYEFISKIPIEDRILGTAGPETREQAEVIMMVGLPAAGKTTWVTKYCLENPEKRYNVLGTNALIDKMKVMGLPRKRNYAGRWETLIDMCTRCLNKLLSMASKRRRNYIIDQTNVYATAQKRKMKGFDGFQRKAIVVCPPDQELKERTHTRGKEEGKEVPVKAVMEMKANFALPSVGETFDAVEYIELPAEEAFTLVQQYNKEAEEAGCGSKPRNFRPQNRQGNYRQNERYRQDRPRRDYARDKHDRRGGWDRDRDRRGGYDRRDRGRDNRDYRRDNRSNRDHRGGGGGGGGHHRDRYGRGSGGGSGGGGGGGGNSGNYGGYGGGWNDYKPPRRGPPPPNQYGQQGWGNDSSNNQWGNNNQGNWSSQPNYNQYPNWNQNYYQQNQQSTPSQPSQQYWTNAYGNQNYNQQQQQQQPYGNSQYGQGYNQNYNTAGYSSQGYNYNQQQAVPPPPQPSNGSAAVTPATTPAPQTPQSTQPPQPPQPQWNYNQAYNYDQYNRK